MTLDRRGGGCDWVRFLATLGPIGKSPVAPGTAGSLVGFAVYAWVGFALGLPDYVYWILCAVLPVLAVPLCYAAEKSIGRKDPPEIVLDEFSVIPLCFLGTVTPSEIPGMSTTETFVWFLVAFGLFRFFDVVKPFGIRASQRLPRGWGIVVDDALAALCVCGCLNLVWRWLGPGHEFPFQLTQTL